MSDEAAAERMDMAIKTGEQFSERYYKILDQERHKIIVPAKTESCFFISNLEESDTVTVNFLVISFREASK